MARRICRGARFRLSIVVRTVVMRTFSLKLPEDLLADLSNNRVPGR
jgi:hypothetical protein